MPVVLFDGVCNLCNGFVQFVIPRDPRGYFKFGTLQSAFARRLLSPEESPSQVPDTVVLVEQGRVFTRSTAVLRIARHLAFPWPLLSVLLAIPAPIRDRVYAIVAKNRYGWFGRRDACMVPTPEIRSRFLD